MKTVDTRGHRCPVPTLRLRRALASLGVGELVELRADDPMARIDVPHFVREAGHVLVEASEDGIALHYLIRKGG